MSDVVPVEYLYQPWVFEDLDGYLAHEVKLLQIIRKTPKRVYFADMFGRTRYVDRVALDRDGCAGVGRGTGRYHVYVNLHDAEPTPRETTAPTEAE